MKSINSRPEKLAWVAAIIALLLLIVGISLSKAGNCTAMVPASVAAAACMLLSLASGVRMRFSQPGQRVKRQSV